MKKLITKLFALALTLSAFPMTARADSWWDCRPTLVEERSGNRVQVACSNSITMGSDSVNWVSIPNSDAEKAARFISLATAALLSGKNFRVFIPTSSATNNSGCNPSDCRTPTTFGVRN